MPSSKTSPGPWSWLAITVAAMLAGCAGLDGIPRKPGLYAVEGKQLQRLDGDLKWEQKTWPTRSTLAPGISIVIRDQALAAAAADPSRAVRLYRVGWLRSEISRHGDILPATGNQWVDADIAALAVPVQLQRDADHREVVRVIPREPLAPGLYTLRTQLPSKDINTRFGVGWPAVDRRNYAATNCVDRYLDDSARYRSCAEQQLAIATASLQVHLVKPEMRALQGQARQLVIKGVVVNTSDRRHRIPPLKAELVTDRGRVVERWEFNADAAELAPGASAPFESSLPNPPPGATDVHVTFFPIDARFDETAATQRQFTQHPPRSTLQ